MTLRTNSNLAAGVILLVVLAGGIALKQMPILAAQSQVRHDIASGRLHYTVFGRAPDPSVLEVYTNLLQRRYGIQLNYTGCDVIPNQTIEAYNKAAQHLLRQKYGRDVLQECWDEAVLQANKPHH